MFSVHVLAAGRASEVATKMFGPFPVTSHESQTGDTLAVGSAHGWFPAGSGLLPFLQGTMIGEAPWAVEPFRVFRVLAGDDNCPRT